MQIKKIYVGMFVMLMVLLCVQAITAESNEMVPNPESGTAEGAPDDIEPENVQNSTTNEGDINQLEYTYSYNWRNRWDFS